MKRIKLIALLAALAVPALGWAASKAATRSCPIPCDDCPLAKR